MKVAAYLIASVFLVLSGCDQWAGGDSGKVVPIKDVSIAGVIEKGESWQFVIDNEVEVIWTVEGGSEGGGTTMSPGGVLTVGRKEANITLTIKAISAEDDSVVDSATVKVKGWKEITENLAGIFSNGLSGSQGRGGIIGITAAAYGAGKWVVAGHSAKDWDLPVIAYSKDDGESWVKADFQFVTTGEGEEVNHEHIHSLIYDGPEGNKKFIAGNYLGNILYSSDGVNWDRVVNIMPSAEMVHANPLMQVVYGVVDVGGQAAGRYIVANGGGRFSWSSDGVSWTEGEFAVPDTTYAMHILPGTGVIKGKRVRMFYGWSGRAKYLGSGVPGPYRTDFYSTDGASWPVLTVENPLEALQFDPSPPSGGYENLPIQMLDTSGTTGTSGNMFKGALFAGNTEKDDAYFRDFVTEKFARRSYNGKTYYIPEDAEYVQLEFKYNNKVRFIAYGNGKYLAIGAGRRAALAHEEAFK
jgi:hypothetical protein